MNKKTNDYMLWVLDVQYAHYAGITNSKLKADQKAFYDGLKEMAEIAISEGYSNRHFIARDENGKHAVR